MIYRLSRTCFWISILVSTGTTSGSTNQNWDLVSELGSRAWTTWLSIYYFPEGLGRHYSEASDHDCLVQILNNNGCSRNVSYLSKLHIHKQIYHQTPIIPVKHNFSYQGNWFFSLQVLGYADYAFTSIFTVEILLKVPINQLINQMLL